jgi:hypothetical protein
MDAKSLPIYLSQYETPNTKHQTFETRLGTANRLDGTAIGTANHPFGTAIPRERTLGTPGTAIFQTLKQSDTPALAIGFSNPANGRPQMSDGSDGRRTVPASNRPTEKPAFSRRITPISQISDGSDGSDGSALAIPLSRPRTRTLKSQSHSQKHAAQRQGKPPTNPKHQTRNTNNRPYRL